MQNIEHINKELSLEYNICAPNKSKTEICLTLEDMKMIASTFNASHPGKTIDTSGLSSKEDYYKVLLERLGDRCPPLDKYDKNTVTLCWLKQDFIDFDHDIKKIAFKPPRPEERLTTFELDDVLAQYERIYPEFKYLGTVPSDFEHKLDLDPNKKYAITINLDKSGLPGSHWVCIFLDLPGGTIKYFDSLARKNIKSNIESYIKYLRIKFNLNVRKMKIRHQDKGNECGIYCIFFIVGSLTGLTFDQLVNNVINNDSMKENRSLFFRKK